MGHVWIFQPDNNPNTQTSKTTQKWVTEHKTKLLLWPFPSSDLNPVENEWGELKRSSTVMELWIWRIWRDSVWRNGLWSLIRCSPNSSGIIGENSELLCWEKDIAIMGANNCGQHELEKVFLTQWDPPPHFQLFYFNDRLEFCEFLEWKIKRINNADLFSQTPLLIFIKGANISGGHCIWFMYYHIALLLVWYCSYVCVCMCIHTRIWAISHEQQCEMAVYRQEQKSTRAALWYTALMLLT